MREMLTHTYGCGDKLLCIWKYAKCSVVVVQVVCYIHNVYLDLWDMIYMIVVFVLVS